MMKREEIPYKDTWDLESIFSSFSCWEENFFKWQQQLQDGLTAITQYQGNLSTVDNIHHALKNYFKSIEEIETIFVYAHLKFDQDTKQEFSKKAYNQALGLIYQFDHLTSFIEPELLHLSDDFLAKLLNEDTLKPYHQYLKKLYDQKQHVLSLPEEQLLSLSQQALHAPGKAFSALNNADIKFASIKDEQGKKHEVTHGMYQVYLKSEDRTLRKGAFNSVHNAFAKMENTIVELLGGKVQTTYFQSKARKFSSCLEMALFPNQIDTSVYHQLIDSIDENLQPLHEYIALRKKILGYDKLYAYDMYLPLSKDYQYEISYDAAADIVCHAMQPLGNEYQSILRDGLFKSRWVDIYENENKRSGAYSSGCYSTMPYILLNFHGTFSDLMTLSHEAGHSMHSYYSNKNQPYQYASYSIFLAEIASTFHEKLTFEYLIENAKNDEERIYLLNQQIDGMRATFFRQAMFAEFELQIHQIAEQQQPLTPGDLKEKYKALNAKYFGKDFTIDKNLPHEFLRIPHFYSNFYVYQYATGIAAAYKFADQVRKEGKTKEYLKFISAGSSKYPLDVLKDAGIDMKDKRIFTSFINEFGSLVRQLKDLLN